MSSIKKVLCLKASNDNGRAFTVGNVYDIEYRNGFFGARDDNNLYTCLLLNGLCVYGEWQPLEEYVCMTDIYKGLGIGDFFFGYKTGGAIIYPQGDDNERAFMDSSKFKKVSEMINFREARSRFEVRHVIYDTKDNKIVNDAMGECYITLSEAQELCDEMNEPKVMKTKYTKEFEYFGMKLMIPNNSKQLVTSARGVIMLTTGRFELSSLGWVNVSGELSVISKVDLNGIDWKETLVEIK